MYCVCVCVCVCVYVCMYIRMYAVAAVCVYEVAVAAIRSCVSMVCECGQCVSSAGSFGLD